MNSSVMNSTVLKCFSAGCLLQTRGDQGGHWNVQKWMSGGRTRGSGQCKLYILYFIVSRVWFCFTCKLIICLLMLSSDVLSCTQQFSYITVL